LLLLTYAVLLGSILNRFEIYTNTLSDYQLWTHNNCHMITYIQVTSKPKVGKELILSPIPLPLASSRRVGEGLLSLLRAVNKQCRQSWLSGLAYLAIYP